MLYVTVKVYKITRFYISLLIIILRSYLVIINIPLHIQPLLLHLFRLLRHVLSIHRRNTSTTLLCDVQHLPNFFRHVFLPLLLSVFVLCTCYPKVLRTLGSSVLCIFPSYSSFLRRSPSHDINVVL